MRAYKLVRDRIGIMIPFGSGNTPVDYREDLRFDPVTGEPYQRLFLPLSGIPTTLAQNAPREASQTAKSYGGIATGYVGVEQVPAARTILLRIPEPQNTQNAKLTVQGYVDPFQSLIGTSGNGSGMAALGPKWR